MLNQCKNLGTLSFISASRWRMENVVVGLISFSWVISMIYDSDPLDSMTTLEHFVGLRLKYIQLRCLIQIEVLLSV